MSYETLSYPAKSSPRAGAATAQKRSRSDIWSARRVDLLIVGACVILALALRGMYALRSGLWRDEALFLYLVRYPTFGDTVQFLRLHESHPPLFYLMMRLWLRLFGSTDNAALALPVVLGAMIVPVSYTAGTRLFGRATGLIAALLMALSGSLADNASYVRPYSLLPLLCLLSVFLLCRGIAEGGWRVWTAYVLTTAAMVYTHNWSWLIVASEWTVGGIVCLVAERTAPLRSARWQTLSEFAAANAVMVALYLPWLPTLLFQSKHSGDGFMKTPALFSAFYQFVNVSLPLPDFGLYLLGGVLLIGAGIRFAQRSHRRLPFSDRANVEPEPRREPRLTVAITLLTAIPLLAFFLAYTLNHRTLVLIPRCEAIVAPCLLMVVSYAIACLPGPRSVRLLVLFGLTLGISYVSFLLAYSIKSNTREMVAVIEKQARPDDLIVITPDFLGTSFNYYYKGTNPQIDFPEMHRVHETTFDEPNRRFNDPVALSATFARIDAARKAGKRVWLIVQDIPYYDALPDRDDQMPYAFTHTGLLLLVRSSQILQHLRQQYGPSSTAFRQKDQQDCDELMVALLFTPHDSSGRPQ